MPCGRSGHADHRSFAAESIPVRRCRQVVSTSAPSPAVKLQEQVASEVGLLDNHPVSTWNDYQEETANFFRSLGMEAETNVAVKGVRTSHDVDVVVRSHHVGFDLMWLIECKLWRTKISKLHVLGLREIVSDTGADRGILMAEQGFQKGALEASQLTNVQLTSLRELSSTAGFALGMAQLRNVQERINECRIKYWDLPKAFRIEHGLWSSLTELGYSGIEVIRSVTAALDSAFLNSFPVKYGKMIGVFHGIGIPVNAEFLEVLREAHGENCQAADTPIELFMLLDPKVAELEAKLEAAHVAWNSD